MDHIEKPMNWFTWEWNARAQCSLGLTDSQESFRGGQAMRSYHGLDLMGKQSTPQLQHQPQWTAIQMLTEFLSPRFLQVKDDILCTQVPVVSFTWPGGWVISVPSPQTIFCMQAAYLSLQPRSDSRENTGNMKKGGGNNESLKVKITWPRYFRMVEKY